MIHMDKPLLSDPLQIPESEKQDRLLSLDAQVGEYTSACNLCFSVPYIPICHDAARGPLVAEEPDATAEH